MNEAPHAGRFEGREHRLPVRVYYEDTDFTGVVYHASHVRYFERGRTDYLRLAGVGHAAFFAAGDPGAFVITRLEIDYLRAARIDDALVVVTTYDWLRGPRMGISQRLLRGAGTIATAKVQAACIRPDGRPRRPPAELIAALATRLAPV